MKLRVKQQIYDSWWPWKLGVITWVGKTRIKIRWGDGSESTYDRPHFKFLKLYDF